MSEKHICVCDRCRKEAKMWKSIISFCIPMGWHKDEDGKDLCSKCWSDRKKYLKKFK